MMARWSRLQRLRRVTEELGRTKAIQGKCWSTPAVSNGRLYVRSTKESACLDLGRGKVRVP